MQKLNDIFRLFLYQNFNFALKLTTHIDRMVYPTLFYKETLNLKLNMRNSLIRIHICACNINI